MWKRKLYYISWIECSINYSYKNFFIYEKGPFFPFLRGKYTIPRSQQQFKYKSKSDKSNNYFLPLSNLRI